MYVCHRTTFRKRCTQIHILVCVVPRAYITRPNALSSRKKERPFQNTPTTKQNKNSTPACLAQDAVQSSNKTKQTVASTALLQFMSTVVVLSPKAAEGLASACPTNRRSTRVHFPNYVHTTPQLCAHQQTPERADLQGCP